MILATTVNDGTTGLIKKFKGTTVGTGTADTNSAGVKSFTSVEVVGSDGLGVTIGDYLHIYGVGVFLVTATPSASAKTLTVSTYIVPSVTGKTYEILRGGLSPAQLVDIQATSAGGHVIIHDPYAPLKDKGFLCNEAAVSGIGTSYSLAEKVTLNWTGTSLTVDPGASEPPDQVKVSHIELSFTGAGSVTGADFTLTWDAAGDHVALGPTPTTVTPFTALSAGGVASLSASFGEQILDFTNAVAVSGKKLYLHIKLTGSGADLATARLYWFV